LDNSSRVSGAIGWLSNSGEILCYKAFIVTKIHEDPIKAV